MDSFRTGSSTSSPDFGFGVWGLGFRFPVLGFIVQGIRVQGFRVQGSRFRVQGSGFRVQASAANQKSSIGSVFRVWTRRVQLQASRQCVPLPMYLVVRERVRGESV